MADGAVVPIALRVYKVGAQGEVTEDRGKREILTGGRAEPVPYTSAYPHIRRVPA
ncbi:hypothetical protein ACIPSA_39820 [Streptomyces sp. NPDC086549]|uniref:hypothetical protein n=1 Tax=Streptomyces sp. NPDC086549 TaxID=3365752 RepID=UPI0037F6071D